MANEIEKSKGEIIIYQSEDGKIRLECKIREQNGVAGARTDSHAV